MRHTSSFAGIQMRKEYVGTQRNVGFPDSSVGKESACNAGDPSLIPRLGRSAGEGEKLPIPLFWPEEFHGLYSPWGRRVGQD